MFLVYNVLGARGHEPFHLMWLFLFLFPFFFLVQICSCISVTCVWYNKLANASRYTVYARWVHLNFAPFVCVCLLFVCYFFRHFCYTENGCSVNFVQRCNVLHWTWTGCVIDNTNPLSHNYSHWFALIFELRVGMVAFTFSAEPAISLPFRYDTLVCFYWTVKIFGFSFTIFFFLPNFVCLFCELEFVRPNHDMQW